jgi:hypothetical protein
MPPAHVERTAFPLDRSENCGVEVRNDRLYERDPVNKIDSSAWRDPAAFGNLGTGPDYCVFPNFYVSPDPGTATDHSASPYSRFSADKRQLPDSAVGIQDRATTNARTLADYYPASNGSQVVNTGQLAKNSPRTNTYIFPDI